MKKYSLFFALFIAANMLASAENMKFVSLLTQPIGTFASVEVADTTKPATMGKLEFCNTGIAGGSIDVSSVDIGSSLITLGGTELRKSDGGTINPSMMTIKPVNTPGMTFVGGALEATNATVTEIEVKENLQIDQANTTTKTASFASMTLTNTANEVRYDGGGSNCIASWSVVASSSCKSAQHGNTAACEAKLVFCDKTEQQPSNPEPDTRGVWRLYGDYQSTPFTSCSSNCGCNQEPCWQSALYGDGTCSASEIGDICAICECDDGQGGTEQWADTCPRTDYSLRCEAQ